MKINLFSFFSLLLLLLVGVDAAAQTSCAVPGWASQNGGTTGGGAATPTVVSNYTDFKNAVTNAAVKVVHVSGTIAFPAAGRINFQDQTGKTIYGLPGSRLVALDRTASGSGTLYIKRCSNIIFRNITFEGPGAFDTDGNDHLTIDNCTNVWVDHCDFQDGVDGNLDVKNLADYISITWCRFVYLKPPIPGGSGGADDHRFSNLFGSSDGATGDRGKLRITMQNCWWAQGCRERMPRVRFGKVHLVNNYFSSAGNNHCIRAGFEADLRVESNYFENVNNPIDLFENDFTAVSELNNVFVGTTGGRTGQGTAFTPPYALAITPATNVKATVSGGAGGHFDQFHQLRRGHHARPPTSYTLTTTASPAAGGTVSRSPNASSYAAGTVVTLTATPAAGYTFAGWSGAASGSSATTTVTVNANATATATFTATPASNFTLTVSRNPVAGGTVAQSPNAASYAPNTVVTLTATPAAGYVFAGWSGASTATTASTTVTMNANKSITANFTASGGGGGSTTLRIEEAATETSGFCGANGSRQNSYTGADNGFYINLSNSAGRGIDWNVNAPAAGTYTLRFRYANAGGSSATTARVLVNGASAVASVPFPKTAAWTTWTTTTASVALRAGVNAIRLETTVAAEFANIDWLEVTGNIPTAAACSAARMAPATPAATLDEPSAARLYPNPASDRTAVKFALTESGPVAIQVYDFRGQRVKTLTDRVYSSGSHAIALDDLGLKPGAYTLVVVSGQGKQTLRLEVR